MKNIRRKITVKILITVLLFCFIIVVPVSYSKYVRNQLGVSQALRFATGSEVITDGMVITEETLNEENPTIISDNLWGAGSIPPGKKFSDLDIEEYKVTNVNDIELPIKNETEYDILVSFVIKIYAFDGLNNCYFKANVEIENETTGDKTKSFTIGNDDSANANIMMTKTSTVSAYTVSILWYTLNYYPYEITINPSNYLQTGKTVYDGFVLKGGENIAYTYKLHLDDQSRIIIDALKNLTADTYAAIEVSLSIYNP